MNNREGLVSLKELESQIASQVAAFNNRRVKMKRMRNALVVAQGCLSAITTVLIAANIDASLREVSIIAIVTSTTSGLAGTFLTQFMFHERLASHISTVCGLRELQAIVTMHSKMVQDNPSKHHLTTEDVQQYFRQFQEILNVANSEWQKLMRKSKDNSQKHDNANH